MAERVYIVTHGSYSDYKVYGVFSTEDKAEEFRVAFGFDDVEEYALDPPQGTYAKQGRRAYQVVMLKDGSTERVGDATLSGRAIALGPTSATLSRDSSLEVALSVLTWATDEGHAVKIANEIRTRILAEGRWPCGRDTPEGLPVEKLIGLRVTTAGELQVET